MKKIIFVCLMGLFSLVFFVNPQNNFDKAGLSSTFSDASYGLQLLSSSYTGKAINVCRSRNNTTQDIGFDANGYLDVADLTSFVGSGSGFVTKCYDQSVEKNLLIMLNN